MSQSTDPRTPATADPIRLSTSPVPPAFARLEMPERAADIGAALGRGVTVRSWKRREIGRWVEERTGAAARISHEVGCDAIQIVSAVRFALERGCGFEQPVIGFLQQVV